METLPSQAQVLGYVHEWWKSWDRRQHISTWIFELHSVRVSHVGLVVTDRLPLSSGFARSLVVHSFLLEDYTPSSARSMCLVAMLCGMFGASSSCIIAQNIAGIQFPSTCVPASSPAPLDLCKPQVSLFQFPAGRDLWLGFPSGPPLRSGNAEVLRYVLYVGLIVARCSAVRLVSRWSRTLHPHLYLTQRHQWSTLHHSLAVYHIFKSTFHPRLSQRTATAPVAEHTSPAPAVHVSAAP